MFKSFCKRADSVKSCRFHSSDLAQMVHVGNIGGPAFSNNTINVRNADLCEWRNFSSPDMWSLDCARRLSASSYREVAASVDYIPIHNDVFAMRVEGTGSWLLNSTEFKNWRDAPNNATLWCPGRRKSYAANECPELTIRSRRWKDGTTTWSSADV